VTRKRSRTVRKGAVRKVSDCIAIDAGQLANGSPYLSGILNSDRAVDVNIAIMRAFVRVRELLATHKELARKLEELEKKYDGKFRTVFEAIRKLMEKPSAPVLRIKGFRTDLGQ
jgi:hypothetical protein